VVVSRLAAGERRDGAKQYTRKIHTITKPVRFVDLGWFG